jgi:imidazolonepropionase-like amidohydrolase
VVRAGLAAAIVGLAAGVAGLGAQPSTPGLLVVSNVTVVDGTGAPPLPARTVIVRSGHIQTIASAEAPIPPDARRLDGTGRFLVPGLVDAHVHVAIRPDAEVSSTLLTPLFVAHGVLAVRDMGGDLTRLNALRASLAAGHLRGPEIVTPGPFIDGPQAASPTVRPVASAAQAAQAVAGVAAQKADFIKVQAGLSADIWRAVLAAARAAGLHVAGHVPESLSAFDVVGGGQRTVEHVSPALPGDAGLMLSVSSEEAAIRAELRAIGEAWAKAGTDRPGLRARQRTAQRRIITTVDPVRSAELFALMRDRGVIAVPTLVWSNGLLPLARDDRPTAATMSLVPRALGEPWLARRTAQLAAAPADDLAFNAEIAEASRAFVGAMHRAGVAIAAGTDSFDDYLPVGAALHRELEELVRSGLTSHEALQAGTRVAARAMERSDRGTIETGKVADLVLLDADPTADISATRRIHAVIQRGEVLDAGAIAKLLADARATAAK